MYKQRLTWILLALIAWLGNPGARGLAVTPISPPVDRQTPDEQFVRYTLRAGTAMQVLLQTPLGTDVNQVGDPVESITTQNIYLGEALLLPRSTRLKGVISRLDPPVQGRDAVLGIQFTEILLEDGEKLPISAYVRTEHPEHIWGGLVTRGTKPKLSVQRVWGIGEYNRVVYGGPRAMGSHIQFKPGEFWTVVLAQPLTLVKPAATGL